MSDQWSTEARVGARLRWACPVLASLTKGETVREIERELQRTMSRGQARRLIAEAKALALALPRDGVRSMVAWHA